MTNNNSKILQKEKELTRCKEDNKRLKQSESMAAIFNTQRLWKKKEKDWKRSESFMTVQMQKMNLVIDELKEKLKPQDIPPKKKWYQRRKK